jgi:uncharacterized protein YbjT (DUF2867 family)
MRRTHVTLRALSSLGKNFIQRSYVTQASNGPSVTIFGGNGSLGRQITSILAPHAGKITIACRNPEVYKQTIFSNVSYEKGDIRDIEDVQRLTEGRSVIINCIGPMYEDSQGLVDAYVTGVQNVAHTARLYGVERFIHVSAMGAQIEHPSIILDFKYRSENMAFGASSDNLTIVRPAIMFDSLDRKDTTALLNRLAKGLRFLPIIPMSYNQRVNPVFVDDVALAIAKLTGALPDSRDARGKTVLLEGPNQYTLAQAFGRAAGRPVVPLPKDNLVWEAVLGFRQFLPKPVVTRDHLPIARGPSQLTVEETINSIVDPNEFGNFETFENLGITPQSMDKVWARK